MDVQLYIMYARNAHDMALRRNQWTESPVLVKYPWPMRTMSASALYTSTPIRTRAPVHNIIYARHCAIIMTPLCSCVPECAYNIIIYASSVHSNIVWYVRYTVLGGWIYDDGRTMIIIICRYYRTVSVTTTTHMYTPGSDATRRKPLGSGSNFL